MSLARTKVRTRNLDEDLAVILLIEIPKGPALQRDKPWLATPPWQPLLDLLRIDPGAKMVVP